MSLQQKLIEAAEEKVREWEDFLQNCIILSKQFSEKLIELAGVDRVRYHPAGEAAELGADAPLPQAVRFHDGGWAKVLAKFDVGHVTVKVPIETRVHEGQAELRVFEMTEGFDWPVAGAQLEVLEGYAKRVLEAIIDDLRNDLELYMQGKLKRAMKFS